MQAVDGILSVGAVSKLRSSLVVEASSFPTPQENALLPAYGIAGAIKLALVFWAVLATLAASWLTL